MRPPHLRAALALLLALLLALASPPPLPAQIADAGVPLKAGFIPSVPIRTTLRGRHQATVTAAYFSRNGKEIKGGTGSVTVTVDDNPERVPSVGVQEGSIFGVGTQCEASAWIAAIAASQAMGRLMTEHKFTVEVRGYVNGPSMGLLLTATMLALMNGDGKAIRPEVTMTGAINPDGTAGPVGGIPHKLEGAQAKGLKFFGYPVGCSQDPDLLTRDPVDINARAKELGLEAVELSNLQDAYRLLTGKTWPTTARLEAKALKMSDDTTRRIRGARETVESHLEKARNGAVTKLKRLDAAGLKKIIGSNSIAGDVYKSVTADLSVGQEHVRMASDAARSGSEPQAFFHTRFADECFTVAEVGVELLQLLLDGQGSLKEWKQHYEQTRGATQKSLDGLKTSLGPHLKMTRLGGKVDALHSYLHYGEAVVAGYWGNQRHVRIEETIAGCVALEDRLTAIAAGRVRGVSRDEVAELKSTHARAIEQLMLLLWKSSVHLARAERKATVAASWVPFAKDNAGPPVRERPEVYVELGSAYAAAASAAQAYFEALLFDDLTTPQGMLRKRDFEQREEGYGFISAAAQFAAHEPAQAAFLKRPSDPLERFTAALFAYTGSSALMMNYYTFEGDQPSAGNAGKTTLRNPTILASTLDGTRDRVLEECARLQAEFGFIPDSIAYNFDLASKLRDEGDAAKLIALKAYWRCSLLCYLTHLFSRP